MPDGLLDHGFRLFPIAYVAGNGEDADAFGKQVLPGSIEFLLAAGEDRQIRTLLRKLPGDGKSQPAGASSD
jgi:hypothetical protein